MWDNRETKKSPKQPDYKCKNKQCDKAIWLEKRSDSNGAPSNGNGNGHHAPSPVVAGGSRPLGPLYNECLDFAGKACKHYFGEASTPADVIAAAATLFIQAVRDGGTIRGVKPAPPPPPPPPVKVTEVMQGSYWDDGPLPF